MAVVRYHFSAAEIVDLTITSDDPINEVTIRFAYDWTERKFRSAITKHNPLSKLLYGEAQQAWDLRYIQQARQAEIVADAVLQTASQPPLKVSFEHDLRSLYLEVGDLVTLTHPAGLGESGWEQTQAVIRAMQIQIPGIAYEVELLPTGSLFRSELVTLTQTAGPSASGITVTYEQGVATITIYADVQGSPPVEGAEVTIQGVLKVTDSLGQARFSLAPGTYTAYIRASGYEDAEVTFTV